MSSWNQIGRDVRCSAVLADRISATSPDLENLLLVFLKRLLAVSFVLACLASPTGADEGRRFVFEYEAIVGPIPEDSGPIHIFVPLAANNRQQKVLDEEITSTIDGVVETDGTYGNRYWHGWLDHANVESVAVKIRTRVERRASRQEILGTSRSLSTTERKDLAEFLKPNARVVVDDPVLTPIRDEIRRMAGSEDPARLSRAIYDWVVENIEYKKVGTGWGNGDTFWACNERSGNCTDFHSLFISLARSEGIPARFEMGFPVPNDRDSGMIEGYHCWVEFYLPEIGWIPIDASEAFKHPEKKEFFYGTHPADRILMTTGRDLRLGDGHQAPALNYFVYPHVEVDGATWTGTVQRTFSYSEAN